MDSDSVFLVEFLIFGGAAVAWGVWQIWSVRRGKDWSKDDHEPPDSDDSSGHPER